MIHFEINGRPVELDKLEDVITRAILQSLEAMIRKKVGSIRDPATGEFPTIVVRGDNLESLQFFVEGSPQVVQLVQERLGLECEQAEMRNPPGESSPRAFLSYTSDDAELAERIAHKLQSNGIDTWWDRWSIRAGDSLRQRIDEGLGECTHFLVLLTPQSIRKPWVNQEMDAGLVRKLKDECIFMPVRFRLPATELPPLLSGLHAPEILDDEDLTQLINDIHGISRKPPLGQSPHATDMEPLSANGYSTAANIVARYFVEITEYGRTADPIIDAADLVEATGLTMDDTKDALYELSGFFKPARFHVMVKASLFAEFDRHWKPWDPRVDALRLAADILNDKTFPAHSRAVSERYGWEPRRLNPAVTYLQERGLLVEYKVLGDREFEHHRILGKPG